MMTPAREAEIRQRLEDWRAHCGADTGDHDFVLIFEAHAADDVDWLLAELDRVRAERDEARAIAEALLEAREAALAGSEPAPAMCSRCNGAEVDTYVNPESPTGYTERPCPACQPAPAEQEPEHVCGLTGYCPGPPHYDPICPACYALIQRRQKAAPAEKE